MLTSVPSEPRNHNCMRDVQMFSKKRIGESGVNVNTTYEHIDISPSLDTVLDSSVRELTEEEILLVSGGAKAPGGDGCGRDRLG